MSKEIHPVKRKVVNLLAKDFDVIKEYCDSHSLKMPVWIGAMLCGIINNSRKKSVPAFSYADHGRE